MIKLKQIVILIIMFSCLFTFGQANKTIYTDTIFSNNIRTVSLFKDGWELSYPIYELGSNVSLVLNFDDLSSDESDYSYKLTHCNSNWESSNLSAYEYMDGFEENNIRDFNYSINTLVSYTNYTLKIPNEDVTIKISGNYILSVFKNNETKDEVIRKRFYVIDHKISIEAKVNQPAVFDRRKNSQEIDFTLKTLGIKINDPYSDIRVEILQNGRNDNKITNLKPVYVKDNELIYDYDEDNLFYATNEFRYFDTKYLTFNSERIEAITLNKNYYVDLLLDESKIFRKYFYHEDLNGKYLIKAKNSEESNIEADYVFVTFRLKQDIPVAGAEVYVFSNFNNYALNSENKMTFNYESKIYECSMLLKQGYYNYQYAYVENSNTIDVGHFEGNHFDTENDYLIFVYFKDISSNYEKLIGYNLINSLKK